MNQWLMLVVLGGWVGVDATAFLQILVSQPLVAGVLGGWAFGDPGAGLLVGLLIQLVWIRGAPLGGVSLPHGGPAALAGGALAARAADTADTLGVFTVPAAAELAVSLAVALLVGEVGGRAVTTLRRRHLKRIAAATAAADRGDPGGVFRANAAGAIPSALLGAGLATVGVALGSLLLLGTARLPSVDGLPLAAVVFGTGLAQLLVAGGARRWWTLAGLVVCLGWLLR